jgi:hypothetical protein
MRTRVLPILSVAQPAQLPGSVPCRGHANTLSEGYPRIAPFISVVLEAATDGPEEVFLFWLTTVVSPCKVWRAASQPPQILEVRRHEPG